MWSLRAHALSCLSPELVGSPVVASASSVDSLANVLDPSSLPSEVVGPSFVVSDSSEDSLANVPSVPPHTGVWEPSSELVSEVAMIPLRTLWPIFLNVCHPTLLLLSLRGSSFLSIFSCE